MARRSWVFFGFPLQVDLLAGMYLGFVVLHPDDLGLDFAQEAVSDFFFNSCSVNLMLLDSTVASRSIRHKLTGVHGQIMTNPYKDSGVWGILTGIRQGTWLRAGPKSGDAPSGNWADDPLPSPAGGDGGEEMQASRR